ncbi:hypothetical protein CLOP_g4289 [Closterium sp. NIES-67]|nr:hypothetical protein CLOP_g4289 [Closterium sp. NIES-67]
MRELYAKLAIAGITYPEQTKSAMPCKGHGGIEGVAIAVALTTVKVVAGLGTSGGVVALVQEEEVVTPTMTTVNHA